MEPPQPQITEFVEKALKLRNLDDPQRNPIRMGDRARSEVGNALRVYDERLLGCPRPWLLQEVTRLMAHYWGKFDDERQQTAVLEDWVNDLCEYPAWALSAVFKAWRHSEKYAPKISEIIERVNAKTETDQRRADQLRGVLKLAERSEGQAAPAARPKPRAPLPDSNLFWARPENVPPDSAPHHVKAEWASKLVAEATDNLKSPESERKESA